MVRFELRATDHLECCARGSRPAFTVRLPAGARPMQVGTQSVWAVLTDPDWLPVILKYRVEKSGQRVGFRPRE